MHVSTTGTTATAAAAAATTATPAMITTVRELSLEPLFLLHSTFVDCRRLPVMPNTTITTTCCRSISMETGHTNTGYIVLRYVVSFHANSMYGRERYDFFPKTGNFSFKRRKGEGK